jgi:cysteine synthase A
MKGALARVDELLRDIEGAWSPGQFANPANPEVHRRTTGPEIWEQTGGHLHYFVAGIGTGGTLTGSARYLKEKDPGIRAVAVEPAESPVLSGGEGGPHRIQGIGAGFVPEIVDRELLDEVITVDSEKAVYVSRLLSGKEGITAGISAGAAIQAALELSARQGMDNKRIIVIIPDTSERYLSTVLFEDSNHGS